MALQNRVGGHGFHSEHNLGMAEVSFLSGNGEEKVKGGMGGPVVGGNLLVVKG